MESTRRPSLDECARFRVALTPYLDGELSPDRAVAARAHALACRACAERVALAWAARRSLRRTVSCRASARLRTRVASAIRRERERAAETRSPLGALPSPLRTVATIGILAGAASALVFSHVPSVAPGPRPALAGVLDDLVALHADPLPPETTDPARLPSWDPLVGVPVRSALPGADGRFEGARLFALPESCAGGCRAVVLQYTVHGGHRISVYVFDPRAIQVEPLPDEREIGGRGVSVGTRRGYSVATARVHGTGYALLSDLDADESARLLAGAVEP